ncbi:MAG: ketoacyl-ACP synthase III [Saprospiraceae bacterium]|jgi:3-oxoacyl-[acyl-carrier-protein] synthase-3
MNQNFKITGTGYSFGSAIVKNEEVAIKLGLDRDWFKTRTGIIERRICSESENVLTLSTNAIKNACKNANLELNQIGEETLLLHIQNGLTHLTPPPGIIIANTLGTYNMRTLSIDGVCAEPINAFEIAALMFSSNKYQRVIISAGVDFIKIINPNDPDTIGLFGAGGGAVILENTTEEIGLRGLYWLNNSYYYDLGTIKLKNFEVKQDELGINFEYYKMKGMNLAKIAIQTLPKVLSKTLEQCQWTLEDIDFIVSHQPNEKFLDMGIKALGLDITKVSRHAHYLGNMGPASLLVCFALEIERGTIKPNDKVMLMSFGLGFSCGAAALII